jgi:hypothetical protein
LESIRPRHIEHQVRNLVKEYAIPTTRSRLNPYYDRPREQKFADHVFVSSGREVLTVAAVAGVALPPTPDLGEGVLDGDPLPECIVVKGGTLARLPVLSPTLAA